MALKHYPEEFKADAVALYLASSRTYKAVAEDLGINRATLREWVLAARRRGEAGEQAGSSVGSAGWDDSRDHLSSDDVLEEENKQLKARIRELELERDILRKAAKYFAGETNW